jgi:hypothetical protein
METNGNSLTSKDHCKGQMCGDYVINSSRTSGCQSEWDFLGDNPTLTLRRYHIVEKDCLELS